MPNAKKSGQLEFTFPGGPADRSRSSFDQSLTRNGPPGSKQNGSGLSAPEPPDGWRETLARLWPDSYATHDPGRYSWAELCERFPDVAGSVQGEAEKTGGATPPNSPDFMEGAGREFANFPA